MKKLSATLASAALLAATGSALAGGYGAEEATASAPAAATECPAVPNWQPGQPCSADVGAAPSTGPLPLEIALPEIIGKIEAINVAENSIKLQDGKTFLIPREVNVVDMLTVGDPVKIKYFEVGDMLIAGAVESAHAG
jgi:hypothetical protein